MKRFAVKCVRLKIVKEREKKGEKDVVGLVIQSVQIMMASNTVVISSRSRLFSAFTSSGTKIDNKGACFQDLNPVNFVGSRLRTI
jgi:hypothetical protein